MIASMLAPFNESRMISAQFALTVRSYRYAYSDEVRMHPGITRASKSEFMEHDCCMYVHSRYASGAKHGAPGADVWLRPSRSAEEESVAVFSRAHCKHGRKSPSHAPQQQTGLDAA